MSLLELIVIGGVGDGSEMKNGVELFVAELFAPIQLCQIGRNEIAAVPGEILEIAGAKIIDHSQARLWKFFLQRERKVGADKTGAAGDDQIRRRIS